ncbi:hypothetical protein ACLOJK_037616 [Asimina triloba]
MICSRQQTTETKNTDAAMAIGESKRLDAMVTTRIGDDENGMGKNPILSLLWQQRRCLPEKTSGVTTADSVRVALVTTLYASSCSRLRARPIPTQTLLDIVSITTQDGHEQPCTAGEMTSLLLPFCPGSTHEISFRCSLPFTVPSLLGLDSSCCQGQQRDS